MNSWYQYANYEWVDDVIDSQFSINFVHRNDKTPIFQLWENKTCLIHISTLNNMQNNVYSDIFWYGDMLLHVWAQKLKCSNFYTQNIWEKSEAMTSLTHSIAYSCQLFKKCFVENYENSRKKKSLFVSDLHQLFTAQCSVVLLFLLYGLDFSFSKLLTTYEHIIVCLAEWWKCIGTPSWVLFLPERC